MAKKPAKKTAKAAPAKPTKTVKPVKAAKKIEKAPAPKAAGAVKKLPAAQPVVEKANKVNQLPADEKPRATEKPSKKAAPEAIPEGVSDQVRKWYELKNQYGDVKAPAYNMSAQYEPNTPIQHKVLGWGFILSVQNDRLEVIFEQGLKILISNYKA